MIVLADKMGSATSRLELGNLVQTIDLIDSPRAGDVIVVRALSESVTYGNIELPSGRLAKINRGDVIIGVLGKRRALKGFVGDVPPSVSPGDRLHLLNMGGVIGRCVGHHSSLSDAIEVEVIGGVADSIGTLINIDRNALNLAMTLNASAPIIIVAGTCMNSGKTVAATEIIKQANQSGLRVAGGKVSGIACLRDTLNMQDHGAIATASFLDCGLPSTVDHPNLSAVAKGIVNHLNTFDPHLIILELGDGIVGGYSVDSVLNDAEIRKAISCFVFCASDYVGVVGGIAILKSMNLKIDVIAGSVTDSQMGEDFVEHHYGIRAGNARRDGRRLFELTNVISESHDRIAAQPAVAAALGVL
ncbi:MAG TPA: hypothetical protein VK468_01605 [Pyrinomonadaceae bacterium]|nr:hypothetical protein [Pyrinomonadaceae bacterium]